jgi:hypothetical protein
MLFPTDQAGSDRIAEGELTLSWRSADAVRGLERRLRAGRACYVFNSSRGEKRMTQRQAISGTVCRFVNEANQKTANIRALAEERR